jgi:hypothetical protein
MCGGPAGPESTPIETADGSVLDVCPECAARFGCLDFDGQAPAEEIQSFEQAMDVITALAQQKEEEAEALKAIASFVTAVSEELHMLQNSLIERDDRVRAHGAELERLRDRLKKAEALLVTGRGVSGPQPSQAAASAADQGFGLAPESESPPEAPEPSPPLFPLAPDALRAVERIFNESPHVEKTRAVRRGLGQPIVNLTPLSGEGDRVLLTIAWEIVWYQYLIELGEGVRPEDRLTLFGEGMQLDELSPNLRENNAGMDQQGRIDVSEIELTLLKESGGLLTDLPPDRTAALDDATEEIWDQKTSPEFRWKD